MNGLLDGIMIDTQPSRAEEADREAATERLAVTTIRKIALRHDLRCPGTCAHRNHRRDNAGLADGLTILGLGGDSAQPDDYESRLNWDTTILSGTPDRTT
jgi:hypothetical protein